MEIDLKLCKVAIVHDWLTDFGGAEKVLIAILELFPQADLFTVVDHMDDSKKGIIKDHKITTSFIQNLPFSKAKYRNYLPLMPIAIEQFDLIDYELVLSSSYAVAKGVITGPEQLHISYCHSPIRYAWDMQFQYLEASKLTKGLKSKLARYFLHKIRIWDYRTAHGVDHFIANSNFIGKRIKKVYGRESTTIYPNVSVNAFKLKEQKDDFYLTASRMVPYKKFPLIVEAFNQMPDRKLVVIGDGPDLDKIKAIANENVTVLGYQEFDVLKDYMQRAKAFVFAAKEDFGIIPLEAQACGTPVIAFGKGGCLETVKDNITGVFFNEQTSSSIIKAIFEFELKTFDPIEIRANAISFSEERFKEELYDFIEDKMEIHKND